MLKKLRILWWFNHVLRAYQKAGNSVYTPYSYNRRCDTGYAQVFHKVTGRYTFLKLEGVMVLVKISSVDHYQDFGMSCTSFSFDILCQFSDDKMSFRQPPSVDDNTYFFV